MAQSPGLYLGTAKQAVLLLLYKSSKCRGTTWVHLSRRKEISNHPNCHVVPCAQLILDLRPGLALSMSSHLLPLKKKKKKGSYWLRFKLTILNTN